MKDKILEIINKNPKSFPSIIKKDQTIMNWLNWDGISPISKTIFDKLYPNEHICENGNQRNFISFNKGYGNCGRASICQCARQDVSSKVSKAKKSYSDDEKKKINEKRRETILKKYGVENIGQTDKARIAHENFYNNPEKVNKQVQKFIKTMTNKYGISNPAKLEYVKHRMKHNNPMSNPDIAKKSASTRQDIFDPTNLFKQNYANLKKNLSHNMNIILLTTEDEYKGVKDRPVFEFKCNKCGYIFKKRFDYGCLPICRACNPYEPSFTSKEEQNLLDFVKSVYDGKIIHRDRSTINPFEVNILLPDLKLGIEYCGLYWHSENSSGKKWGYHQRKMILMNKREYNLITIFSDEWLHNQEVIENMLKVKLGKATSIYGRHCNVKEIDKKEASDFINNYHIQGSNKRHSICLGLYHNDELISVMSFKRKVGNSFELSRFCSSKHVIGGAGKLFKHFCIKYNPECVISFSDNRYSFGNMYEKLGFHKDGTVPPMQYYVENYNKKYHKLYFSKSKISKNNPGKTEWEIMQENGYDRIWDCGKVRWVWRKK